MPSVVAYTKARGAGISSSDDADPGGVRCRATGQVLDADHGLRWGWCVVPLRHWCRHTPATNQTAGPELAAEQPEVGRCPGGSQAREFAIQRRTYRARLDDADGGADHVAVAHRSCHDRPHPNGRGGLCRCHRSESDRGNRDRCRGKPSSRGRKSGGSGERDHGSHPLTEGKTMSAARAGAVRGCWTGTGASRTRMKLIEERLSCRGSTRGSATPVDMPHHPRHTVGKHQQRD